MRYEISDKRVDANSYVVCLVPVPEFPDKKDDLNPIVRTPLLSVCAAVHDDDGWSFCNLTADEKHIIGDKLLELKTPLNSWVWCTQFSA